MRDYVGQWVVLYNQQKICRGFESHRLHVSALFRESQKGNTVFASGRAGDVNGYDSFAPEYYGSAWRGERALAIPVTKLVRVNWWTPKQNLLLVI